MTRHITANRRYRVVVDVLANGESELIVVAPDEDTAEVMAQRLIDAGAFVDFVKTSQDIELNLDISIAYVEDIGNAIGE